MAPNSQRLATFGSVGGRFQSRSGTTSTRGLAIGYASAAWKTNGPAPLRRLCRRHVRWHPPWAPLLLLEAEKTTITNRLPPLEVHFSVLIQRREYKYLIDEATAARVRALAEVFCERDPFAVEANDGQYTIDSLYFDTPGWHLFRANAVEQLDRFKLRVRRYPASPGAPVFFEVKRRYNDTILKTRGPVAPDVWKAVLEDWDLGRLGATSPKNRGAVERFVALTHTYHARPVVLVRYEREAWFSRIDDYARVTFDRCVRAQGMDRLSHQGEAGRWRAIDGAVLAKTQSAPVILELKFTTNVPRWMVHLVSSENLLRRAFSKYGNGVIGTGLTASSPSPWMRQGL